MSSRRLAPTLLAIAALLLVACGEDDDGGADDVADAGETITIRAISAGPFEDAPSTVASGEVTLRLVNDDGMGHSLRIEELGDGVSVVPGGEEGTATVELDPGTTYTFYCDVPGHRDLGMEGEFRTEG